MGIDWNLLTRKFRKLDEVLEEVWDLRNAGGLWFLRALLLFVAGLIMGALAMHMPLLSLRCTYRALAIVPSVGGVCLLFQLTVATTLCVDARIGSGSIFAVAMSFAGTEALQESDDTQKYAYHNFITLLSARNMGVQVNGVVITAQLVLNISLHTIVYVPVAIALL